MNCLRSVDSSGLSTYQSREWLQKAANAASNLTSIGENEWGNSDP